MTRSLALMLCLTGCTAQDPRPEPPAPDPPLAEEPPATPPEQPSAPAPPQARIVKEGGVLRVSPPQDACPSIRIRLVRASLELKRCKGRPWSSQVRTLGELLQAARAHRGDKWKLKRLTMGADRFAYPALSERLIAVTKKRVRRPGKVTPKDLNDLVIEVANEQRLYGEVIEIMAAVDLSPTMKWAEKCNRAGCLQVRYDLSPIARESSPE